MRGVEEEVEDIADVGDSFVRTISFLILFITSLSSLPILSLNFDGTFFNLSSSDASATHQEGATRRGDTGARHYVMA